MLCCSQLRNYFLCTTYYILYYLLVSRLFNIFHILTSLLGLVGRPGSQKNGIPARAPNGGRSADRRMLSGARSRPAVGGPRVLASKRSKCLFLQCFGFSRAFLEPSRSVSLFFRSRSRGLCRPKSAERGGRTSFQVISPLLSTVLCTTLPVF